MADVNYAAIPSMWSWGAYAPNAYVDNTIVRTPGSPSIRLEPSPAGINTARELDGTWLNKGNTGQTIAGAHIIAKIWVHMDSLLGYTPNPANRNFWCGGRFAFDFECSVPGIGLLIVWSPFGAACDPTHSTWDQALWVQWGTTPTGVWVLRTYDFTVPISTFTCGVDGSGTQHTFNPQQLDTFVPWVQVEPFFGGAYNPSTNTGSDSANAWFADAELYINPTGTPPPPPPSVDFTFSRPYSVGGTPVALTVTKIA